MSRVGKEGDWPILRGESLFNAEAVRAGSFSDYLLTAYLPAYFEGRPRYYREIPNIITDILTSMLSGRQFLERVDVTGGVARCMAAGMPDRFWRYPRFFDEVWQNYSQSEDFEQEGDTPIGLLITEILEHSRQGPADLDLKVLPRVPAWTFTHMLTPFNKKHSVTFSSQEQGGITRTIGTFAYNDHFTVRTEIGPIPTNPDREGATIDIIDKSVNRRAFSIHLGLWPKEVRDVVIDKRLGETCDKQDFCIVPLHSVKNGLFYVIPPAAEQVMRRPDNITELAGDIGKFMEVTLRTLRINLLHANENLVDFGFFFKFLNDESMWRIRTAVEQFALRGAQTPDHIKPIIIREFLLCLTIDPYSTMHFLRTTGFSLLIPGLSGLSITDWQSMLASNTMALTKREGRRLTPVSQRGIGYLAEQRVEYMKSKLNGVEMFMQSLEEVRDVPRDHSFWFNLVDLFERKEEGLVVMDSALATEPESRKNYRVGDVWISMAALSRQPLDEGGQIEALRSLLDQLTNRGPVEKTLDTHGGFYLHEIRGHKLDIDFAKSFIAILYRFPTGFTLRQLAVLVPHKEFDWQVLLLKLNGYLDKYTFLRQGKSGVVPVELYCLRTSPTKTSILTETEDPRFISEFLRLGPVQQRPVRFTNALTRAGITPFIEVLSALTVKDFEMLQIRYWPSKPDEALRLVEQLLQAHESSQSG